MKQRVGLARALAVNPAVLLMDEPLSALDAQTRELLMDDLVRLSADGRFAGVYVTHNLAEAVRLGHRIVVLSRRPGRVRAVLDIARPIAERRAGDPDLEAKTRELWDLLKADAAAADRELIDG
jgi:NitT/TauT family transport system ATP-binding protein